VPLRGVRPDIDVISGGERLDDLAGLLLSRHRNGAAVADVLAEPLSMMLETGESNDQNLWMVLGEVT